MRFLVCIFLTYACLPIERDNTLNSPSAVIGDDTIVVVADVSPDYRAQYIDALKKYLGTRELTGNNDGEIVAFILKNCGFDMPQPWCGCFLNQGMLDIGQVPPKGPGWSPSWMAPSRIVWKRDRDKNSVYFEQGWVFGIYFRSLGRVGHVGAVVEDFGDGYFLTIEGNTNSAGSREGNGVFMRIRNKAEIYACANWIRNE